MNTENTHQFNKKLALSCLCMKHETNSTCEVYLRNNKKWTKRMEEEKVARMNKFFN